MNEKPSDIKGRGVTLWLDIEVISALERSAAQLERSKSWLVNMVMREKLAFPPSQDFKGKDKL